MRYRAEMRGVVDDFMVRLVSPGSKIGFDHLHDWGLNLPVDYALQTFQVWTLSEYQVMPEPGGWNDQDAQWRDDMLTLLSVKSYHERRVKSGGGLNKDAKPTGLGKMNVIKLGTGGA